MVNTAKQIRFASYIMMGSVILSSLLGFGRDVVMSQLEGANRNSDVYFLSFMIPDILNHLMASGALSVSFVPLLATYVVAKDQKGANELFRGIATIMGGFILLLILIAEIFAADLARLTAPGFDSGQLVRLTELLRIILPAQFFFYVGGLAISVQYAHRQFIFPALAPVIYNLGIIIFGIALHSMVGVKGFSIGVLVGCFFSHGILQLIGIKKLGYTPLPLFSFGKDFFPAFRKYLFLTFPVMIGFSLIISDEWLIKYFGSLLSDGAVSWLNYARKLMRMPVTVIAQAAGLASFPFLAAFWVEKKYVAFGNAFLNEIKKLWAATTLATIFMFVHSHSIVLAIFSWKKGAFDATDVTNTAEALQMFSLGILFWASQMIVARGFYAMGKTWLPSFVGTLFALLFIPVYKELSETMGFKGLAVAGSLGVAMYTIVLTGLLLKKVVSHTRELDFRNFAIFCLLWSLFALCATFAAQSIHGFFGQEPNKITALIEIGVSLCLLSGGGILLLRTVFKRFTDNEPLF